MWNSLKTVKIKCEMLLIMIPGGICVCVCEPKLLQCIRGITGSELETSLGMKATGQTVDRARIPRWDAVRYV